MDRGLPDSIGAYLNNVLLRMRRDLMTISEQLLHLSKDVRSNPQSVRTALVDILETDLAVVDRANWFEASILLADALRFLSETNDALVLIDRLLSEHQATDSAHLRAKILHTSGVLRSALDPDASEACLREALYLRQQHDADLMEVSHTLDVLGVVLASQGRFNEAVTCLYKCRDIRASIGNLVWLAAVNLHLGSTHREMQRNEDAIRYYRLAHELYVRTNDTYGAAVAKANEACSLLETARAAEAIVILETLLESPYQERAGFKRFLQSNLACGLSEVGRANDGLDLFIEITGGRDAQRSDHCSLPEIRTMSQLLYLCEHYTEAKQWADAGMARADSAGKPEFAAFLETAARIYSAASLPKKAYKALWQAVEINHDLLKEERSILTLDAKLKDYAVLHGLLRAKFPTLSTNETRACILFYEGHSTKEVATMMSNSVRTVESLRLRASRKMGLSTTKDLAGAIELLSKAPASHALESTARSRNS